MTAAPAIALLVALLCGCASAGDVERRARLVLQQTEPDKLGYCPADHLAKARVAVAMARAAAERGEPIESARHLDSAERHAAEARAHARDCAPAPLPAPVAPPLDGDQDGVEDARDRCLAEREDRDGFVDDDGCPDVDDDGDALSDLVDKCPREPEDPDGFEDLDGCPEPGP